MFLVCLPPLMRLRLFIVLVLLTPLSRLPLVCLVFLVLLLQLLLLPSARPLLVCSRETFLVVCTRIVQWSMGEKGSSIDQAPPLQPRGLSLR